MLVELSPLAYLTLCGLVQDAMLNESDASALLQKVAEELKGVTSAGMIPSELTEQPEHLENLRRAGMAR
jgi:hypothetical protein